VSFSAGKVSLNHASKMGVMTPGDLAAAVQDARQKTLDLVQDLSDQELMGPRLAIVNPLLWEIGHVAWFQEKWVLRHAAGEEPIRADGDRLYDSEKVAHDTRWDLPLPARQETLGYLLAIRDRVLTRLAGGQTSEEDSYFVMLSVLHEHMHTEAFTYTRQTLEYPPPRFPGAGGESSGGRGETGGPLAGDAAVPGGLFLLGSGSDLPFVFDNEKWAHPVELAPFSIARAPVTQSEFAAFVSDGGYRERSLWTPEGWEWRTAARAEHPVYWRRGPDGDWLRRDFDRWVILEPHRPVIHVNWYEASAYCRWAGRRLPAEVEWEAAAAGEPGSGGRLAERKRRFPWGDEPPTPHGPTWTGAAWGVSRSVPSPPGTALSAAGR
jgi:iron(II)-dependent oxidoreductase